MKISNNPISFPPAAIISKFDESEEALKDLLDFIKQTPLTEEMDLVESPSGGNNEKIQRIIHRCRFTSQKALEHVSVINSKVNNIVPFHLLGDIKAELTSVFDSNQNVSFNCFQKLKLSLIEILRISKQLGSFCLENNKAPSTESLVILNTNFYLANVFLKYLFKEIAYLIKEGSSTTMAGGSSSQTDQELIDFIAEVAIRSSQLLSELEKQVVSLNLSAELATAIQKVDRYISRIIRGRDVLSENPSRADLAKKISSDAANYISSFVQMFEIFKDVSKRHSFEKSLLNSFHQCHSDNKALAQMLAKN